jgi:5-methylcytosine-specific restriction endonuclease McrA
VICLLKEEDLVMSLEKLSNEELHQSAVRVARQEQELAIQVLDHLHEVARRRLYSLLGFSSLFDYAVRALKFSEPAAAQRVQALRLTQAVPQARRDLESGRLSLSSAAAVQRFIRKEEKKALLGVQEKADLVSAVSGKSTRETEKILLLRSEDPDVHKLRESEKPISATRTELKLYGDPELIRHLERVRELRGDLSLEEIFKAALNQYLERIDPLRKKAQPKSKRTPTSELHSRYVPKQILRNLHARSGSRCEYKNAESGSRCESRYKLQVDHLVPFALGGKTELENLRLLCPSHNVFAVIQAFGHRKMRPYLRT